MTWALISLTLYSDVYIVNHIEKDVIEMGSRAGRRLEPAAEGLMFCARAI